MTVQQYFEVDNSTNVAVNTVMWDGNTNTWQPPENTTMLVCSTTPAMIWELDISTKPFVYVLKEQIGAGQIGFTWDGTVLTTNEPQPKVPTPALNQPATSGTQVL